MMSQPPAFSGDRMTTPVQSKAEIQVIEKILTCGQKQGKWVGVTLDRLEREIWKENIQAKKTQMGTFWNFFLGRIMVWSDMEDVTTTTEQLIRKGLLVQTIQNHQTIYFPTQALIEHLIK